MKEKKKCRECKKIKEVFFENKDGPICVDCYYESLGEHLSKYIDAPVIPVMVHPEKDEN